MQRLSIEKGGDALSAEAEVFNWGMGSYLGGMLSNKIMKMKNGGVWVNGTLRSDGEWFSFEPGISTLLFNKNTEKVQFHISEVRGIRLESGIIKDTIIFENARGEFKFCCYGAKELANTLISYLQYVQSFNNLYPTR